MITGIINDLVNQFDRDALEQIKHHAELSVEIMERHVRESGMLSRRDDEQWADYEASKFNLEALAGTIGRILERM